MLYFLELSVCKHANNIISLFVSFFIYFVDQDFKSYLDKYLKSIQNNLKFKIYILPLQNIK